MKQRKQTKILSAHKFSKLVINYIAINCLNKCFLSFLCHFYHYYIYIYIYIYIVSWLTVIEGDSKAPFSIATRPWYKGGRYFFLWIGPLTLYTYLIMLSVKQWGIKYHFFRLWYNSAWDWTLASQVIGEHSNQNISAPIFLSLSLSLFLSLYVCVCMCVFMSAVCCSYQYYIYIYIYI